MTKQITPTRLLATLDRISQWHQRINGHNCDVIHALATAGLYAAFGEATGNIDPLLHQKTDLELTLLEIEKTPEMLHRLQDEWKRNLDRKWAKERSVFAIQEIAGISGIVNRTCTIGGLTINFPSYSEEYLPWIESDLEILNREKPRVIQFAINYWRASNKNLWYDHQSDDNGDGWKLQRDEGAMGIIATMAQWADLYVFDDSLWINLGRDLNPVDRDSLVTFVVSDNQPL